MTVYATVEDLESRWKTLGESEKKRAAVLLEDASDLMRRECPRCEDAEESTRKRVACAVVKRAMTAPLGQADLVGASSASMTAGPYTQQASFANPSGDLYLSKAEARSLGGRSRGAFEVKILGRHQ